MQEEKYKKSPKQIFILQTPDLCAIVFVSYEICLSWFLYLKIFSELFSVIKNKDWLQCLQNGTQMELLVWTLLMESFKPG